MYDSIVIGAGIAGSVIARELADRGNKKVLVLEQRDHIGGNCFDLYDQDGILIHQYGPHIFHTNDQRVYEYLSDFTKWFDYSHEVAASVNGRMIPVPFNLNTLHMVYDEERAERLEKQLVDEFGMGARVSIMELKKNENLDIRDVAEYVYENIFLRYTMKQWGQTPEQIDPSVTARVPVLISYDNRYFQDTYQGLPLNGYTPMFEKLLDHSSIDVRLNTSAKDVITIGEDQVYYEGVPFTGPVIYTGPLDELFEYRYGQLPYRTLQFQFENYKKDFYQPFGVVNYTVDEDYTRITEFKYLTGQTADKNTTIVKEYSHEYTGEEGQIPYYAIMNETNRTLYETYYKLVEQIPDFHLLGRLAEYQYYNMDAMVSKALELSDRIIKQEKRED